MQTIQHDKAKSVRIPPKNPNMLAWSFCIVILRLLLLNLTHPSKNAAAAAGPVTTG
jgi:hypothetical protein